MKNDSSKPPRRFQRARRISRKHPLIASTCRTLSRCQDPNASALKTADPGKSRERPIAAHKTLHGVGRLWHESGFKRPSEKNVRPPTMTGPDWLDAKASARLIAPSSITVSGLSRSSHSPLAIPAATLFAPAKPRLLPGQTRQTEGKS